MAGARPAPGLAPFGALPDGRAVEAVVIARGAMWARVLTLGAILHELRLEGVAHSPALGSPELGPYAGPLRYFGAIVGPVANRIGGAQARIAGEEHHFEANEGGRTTLHGGPEGTHAQIWRVQSVEPSAVTLALELPDGLGGFPGNRHITARYAIAEDGALELAIEAVSDAPTLFNFAHHGFWNLEGAPSFAGHRLKIAAESYLPVDEHLLPIDGPAPVDGTPFDFRAGRVLDPERDARLDHNFCLAPARREITPVAELTGTSGLRLTIATTEPGLQVYDAARGPEPPQPGHDGQPLGPFCGLALEPQAWPDAPNHPGFPSICFGPGERYRQRTRFSFDRV
ncbi:MAG: galactose mutarotase [Alphaproteobacteria bacterium]|nr:MAG: galactose mutarotase [Alphaproteobacteria bacterium]